MGKKIVTISSGFGETHTSSLAYAHSCARSLVNNYMDKKIVTTMHLPVSVIANTFMTF